MSKKGQPPAAPPRSPTMQAVVTMITFVIGGPLFGGIVAYGVLALYWFVAGGLTEAAMRFYTAMYETMWVTYFIGLAPAAIVGGIVAYADLRFGGAPFILAAALGLAAGVVWILIAGNTLDNLLRATVLIVCLASTLVCWHMRLQEDD